MVLLPVNRPKHYLHSEDGHQDDENEENYEDEEEEAELEVVEGLADVETCVHDGGERETGLRCCQVDHPGVTSWLTPPPPRAVARDRRTDGFLQHIM